MDLLHITKPEDLVTSYNETRAGFIAIALEKNRRATPYVEEARVLQHRIKKIESPEKLLNESMDALFIMKKSINSGGKDYEQI